MIHHNVNLVVKKAAKIQSRDFAASQPVSAHGMLKPRNSNAGYRKQRDSITKSRFKPHCHTLSKVIL